MPLSEKTKNILLAPFAISHIMQRCALPGLVAMFLLTIGVCQLRDGTFDLGVLDYAAWLKVTGAITSSPIIAVYAVGTFLILLIVVIEYVRCAR